MNASTVIVCLVILAVVVAIVAKGIYNRRHRKGGCGCGCEGCANKGVCHPEQ